VNGDASFSTTVDRLVVKQTGDGTLDVPSAPRGSSRDDPREDADIVQESGDAWVEGE
jgi:hypothetical protein